MAAPLTVLTVAIPGRPGRLTRNMESIWAQTVPIERQLICSHLCTTSGLPQVQYSAAKNALLPSVTTPWTSVLNDDDHWLPHHVEAILPYLNDDNDLVYTWEAEGKKPRENLNGKTPEELKALFDYTNVLDGNCAIRTSVLRDVGGFPVDHNGVTYNNSPARWEDWELWRRMVRAGYARFRCVETESWIYEIGAPGQICG